MNNAVYTTELEESQGEDKEEGQREEARAPPKKKTKRVHFEDDNNPSSSSTAANEVLGFNRQLLSKKSELLKVFESLPVRVKSFIIEFMNMDHQKKNALAIKRSNYLKDIELVINVGKPVCKDFIEFLRQIEIKISDMIEAKQLASMHKNLYFCYVAIIYEACKEHHPDIKPKNFQIIFNKLSLNRVYEHLKAATRLFSLVSLDKRFILFPEMIPLTFMTRVRAKKTKRSPD
ncbi:uncharacterized protein B0P05DRAFT_592810 [Gilbertella persicaria]|uniref:uncharacterized protein n=1 Tax=Gilbertella persicaria TaxID=101096 RepID=UPI002220263C|nr:uncharacterized protein B0P05DRAFT_592810 [Gilbertella persicaria]KAI8047124.1 hypothetical protein B0P05DRAFT_592810 [Gilbertella persicaria]